MLRSIKLVRPIKCTNILRQQKFNYSIINQNRVLKNPDKLQTITWYAMINIYKLGEYKPTASNHNIMCDKCHKTRLNEHVNWQSFDLCLNCAQCVTEQMNSKFIKPELLKHIRVNKIARNPYRSVTKMMQSQFV